VAVAELPVSVAVPSTMVPSWKVTVPSLEPGVPAPLGVVTVAVSVSLCPLSSAVLEALTEIDVGAVMAKVGELAARTTV
jgi:hypothetical protein